MDATQTLMFLGMMLFIAVLALIVELVHLRRTILEYEEQIRTTNVRSKAIYDKLKGVDL